MCVLCNVSIKYNLSSLSLPMEYTTVEGKRLSSKNYYSQGFRYVKSRESSTIIYLKCALFRSHSCRSFAKIDKISNLLEVTKIHNHSEDAHNSDKIVLCNNIKRGAEISTTNLREVLTTVFEIRM